MMIYIDEEYKCHVASTDGTLRGYDVPCFDGVADAFVEGYRYVPPDESWTREDGVVFAGEMIAPWKPWAELDAAQREYERQQLAEATALVNELIGGVEDVQHE